MRNYIDKSMDNVEKEISDLNKKVLDREVESLEYNSKSFEQKIVTSMIVFAIMYVLNLILTPIMTSIGLYSVEMSRFLCMLGALVGTSFYNARYMFKYNDRERFVDYLNAKKRKNRLTEEFNKTIKLAKANTEITINQMTYNNLIAEEKVISSLEDRYNIDEKDVNQEGLKESYKLLTEQKDLLKERIDVGIKKCVLLGRYEKMIQGYRKNSYAIKYGLISLVIGLIAWNLPQIITNLFVEYPFIDLSSLVLSSVIPPAVVSVLFASWGAKRENDETVAFDSLNQELGIDSFNGKLTKEERKAFMEDFDKTINEYAGVNTKVHLVKAQLDDDIVSVCDNSINDSFDYTMENDKTMSLSLKKRDNK